MDTEGTRPQATTDVRVAFEEASATLMLLVTGMHQLETSLGDTDLSPLPRCSQAWLMSVELGVLRAMLKFACKQVQRCRALLKDAE